MTHFCSQMKEYKESFHCYNKSQLYNEHFLMVSEWVFVLTEFNYTFFCIEFNLRDNSLPVDDSGLDDVVQLEHDEPVNKLVNNV
jgi:hypothetical protein